jgi:16S rRNA (guanine966-N2)-methyltransferase
MRVIAGKYRSRALIAPAGFKTRPTSDRLRETLFNILAPRIEGAVFMDLYAGSGAVGIEALSRGAIEVIFVEQAQPALRTIEANLATLGIRAGYTLEKRNMPTALSRLSSLGKGADIVFIDPPYDRTEEYEATLESLGREGSGLLASGAIVVAEHARKCDLRERFGDLLRYRVLKQGDAALSFYSMSAI